jgi:Family of unknown function (DUF5908)
MPVEILEIVVKANVQEHPPGSAMSATEAVTNENDVLQRQALLQECVEQVIEILRHQKER